MQIRGCKLNLNDLRMTVDAGSLTAKKLSLALNSLEKRNRFADLHFHELQKCTTEFHLAMERAGGTWVEADNALPTRTYYEAHITAFLQNLHAVCDSFPYVVAVLLGPLFYLKSGKAEELKESNLGWSDNFYDAVVYTLPKQKKLHRKLKNFMRDKKFLMLRGMVNQNKHQHLIPIHNHFTFLSFEKIVYLNKVSRGKKVTIEDVNVKSFITACHNRLFPKLLILFWTLQQAKLSTNSSAGLA